MKILCILILFNVYLSYGRFTSQWSTNTDPSMIEEGLRKSLKYIGYGHAVQVSPSNASNVVCQTQIDNGLRIRLTFDLLQKRWECYLYKSVVQILSIRFEKCQMIEKDDLEEQSPQQLQSNNDEDDDEARIDAFNQEIRDNGSVSSKNKIEQVPAEIKTENLYKKLDNIPKVSDEDVNSNEDNRALWQREQNDKNLRLSKGEDADNIPSTIASINQEIDDEQSDETSTVQEEDDENDITTQSTTSVTDPKVDSEYSDNQENYDQNVNINATNNNELQQKESTGVNDELNEAGPTDGEQPLEEPADNRLALKKTYDFMKEDDIEP